MNPRWRALPGSPLAFALDLPGSYRGGFAGLCDAEPSRFWACRSDLVAAARALTFDRSVMMIRSPEAGASASCTGHWSLEPGHWLPGPGRCRRPRCPIGGAVVLRSVRFPAPHRGVGPDTKRR